MTIAAVLSLLVAVIAAVVYLLCVGLSKASVAELMRILVLSGALAFLLGAGGQMSGCSFTPAGQHGK